MLERFVRRRRAQSGNVSGGAARRVSSRAAKTARDPPRKRAGDPSLTLLMNLVQRGELKAKCSGPFLQ